MRWFSAWVYDMWLSRTVDFIVGVDVGDRAGLGWVRVRAMVRCLLLSTL